MKVWHIITDFGSYEVPEYICHRLDSVRKTRRGRPDGRTKEGKLLLMWERDNIREDWIRNAQTVP